MPDKDYIRATEEKLQDILNEKLIVLPSYCRQFITAKNYRLSLRTRIAYAGDLNVFMHFVKNTSAEYLDFRITDIPLSAISVLKSTDIESYMDYLGDYEINGKRLHNNNLGKQRKLAAVREMYKYLCKCGKLSVNPAAVIDTPKTKDKEIRALSIEEKGAIFNALLPSYEKDKSKFQLKKTLYNRDVAIITLFLGTGIRLSELVGLNLEDLNMDQHLLFTLAKGGRYLQHFFNDEVYDALNAYLTYTRPGLAKNNPDEKALFVSRLGKRIDKRTVQLMVKKCSKEALGEIKAISPHKFRSTYGTDLYAYTGDIALVSDNLGHKNISTTKQYYAKQNIENLKKNKEFKIRRTP